MSSPMLSSTLSSACQRLASLVLPLLASASFAAIDPQCSEYDKLRKQRDTALSAKNIQQYCAALSGLMQLMPAKPPAPAKLQCEKSSSMSVETWLQVRPSVLENMRDVRQQQCP